MCNMVENFTSRRYSLELTKLWETSLQYDRVAWILSLLIIASSSFSNLRHSRAIPTACWYLPSLIHLKQIMYKNSISKSIRSLKSKVRIYNYTYLSSILSTMASNLGSTFVDSSFDSEALVLMPAYSSIALAEGTQLKVSLQSRRHTSRIVLKFLTSN